MEAQLDSSLFQRGIWLGGRAAEDIRAGHSGLVGPHAGLCCALSGSAPAHGLGVIGRPRPRLDTFWRPCVRASGWGEGVRIGELRKPLATVVASPFRRRVSREMPAEHTDLATRGPVATHCVSGTSWDGWCYPVATAHLIYPI